MTDDPDAAIAQHVHDAWDGSLRLVHITITDEDGDAWPGQDVDRWVIDVRVPITDDDAQAVSVAEVTAFTSRAPGSLEDLVLGYQVSDVVGAFATAVATPHATGETFFALQTSATEMLGAPDLLAIDRLTVRPSYRTLPGLLPAIVDAVRHGPAGRTASWVLVDPSVWDVPFSDEDRAAGDFVPWADSGVLTSMNAAPDDLERLSLVPPTGGIAVGARADEVHLGDAIEHAMTLPAIAVPFDLPPKLPASTWAAAPEDVHGVHPDEATGSITVETHDEQLEVVGSPGTAPQLVGTSASADAATQDWLRAVHQRWWQYEPDLHARIHEVVDEYLATGRIESATDELAGHLHAPDLPPYQTEWPGTGTVVLEALGEDTEPVVFDAVLEDGSRHEHIGVVVVHESGHVRAFLHDEWEPGFAEPEAAVAHLVSLGAGEFFADALHDELSAGVEHAILTGDVRGH
ncbi:hypothetical protein [Curtobacterium oceanosedimentum]|uniref:hypothetical protein n=1 Tax=Curtobacterium oceanosedimentum TaxID=465820 RepID=UPI001CE1B311|nr:hypothetical protein [Curtobacterium oceanosedimentum]MCA5922944.1 hypothetical protein [Curtobacterium oceanosedimentum]